MFVNVEELYIEDAQFLSDIVSHKDESSPLGSSVYYLLFNFKDYSTINIYDDEMNLIAESYVSSSKQIQSMNIYNNYLFYSIDNTIYAKDLLNGHTKNFQFTKLQQIDQIYIDNNILYAIDQKLGLAYNSELVKYQFPKESQVFLFDSFLVCLSNQEVLKLDLSNAKVTQTIKLEKDLDIDTIKLTDDYIIVLNNGIIFYRNLYDNKAEFKRINRFNENVEQIYVSNNQIYSLMKNQPTIIHFQNRKEL